MTSYLFGKYFECNRKNHNFNARSILKVLKKRLHEFFRSLKISSNLFTRPFRNKVSVMCNFLCSVLWQGLNFHATFSHKTKPKKNNKTYPTKATRFFIILQKTTTSTTIQMAKNVLNEYISVLINVCVHRCFEFSNETKN